MSFDQCDEHLVMNSYEPVYKPDQVICGSGQVVVVTGWTVRQRVAKALDGIPWAAIGQLYSPTRGLNFLVRNLLANPQVRYLVILNGTQEDRNAGGCEALMDFLNQGFEAGHGDTQQPCWVVRSPVKAYLDREIPWEVLEQLRGAIAYRAVTSISQVVTAVKDYNAQPALPPWGTPQIFPLVEPTPTLLPGPRDGQRIEGRTIAETWVKILHRVKTTGVVRPHRYNGQWQELIDLVAVVTQEPAGFYFPEPNYLPCDRAFVNQYVAHLLEDAPEREGVEYTYGQRLRSWFGQDQIEQVIAKLSREPDSTRAVMTLWDVADYQRQDNPCLNHVGVRLLGRELGRELVLTATFRSNDMFSAWPANAMGLRALQQYLGEQISDRSTLSVTLGPLITISQSAHIYDDSWENADQVIARYYPQVCRDRSYADPVGNFLIEVAGGTIVVHQTTPGSGEGVKTYRGKNPLVLIRQICDSSPALQPAHAGYLGLELQKAWDCLSRGKAYVQDQ